MIDEKVSIWWIRRDLRLVDNPALNTALAASDKVVPLFILDPVLLNKAAEKRKAFLFSVLESLGEGLRQRGSRLILREGKPVEQLSRLVLESGASEIFAEADLSPYARRRGREVAASLPLRLVSGATIHPPEFICKSNQKPFAVFTAFSKAWKAMPFPAVEIHPAPMRLGSLPELDSVKLPLSLRLKDFPAAEAEAQRRLKAFLNGPIFVYAENRNRLDLAGTSGLSPYFRFGLLSARWAASVAMQAREAVIEETACRGCDTWLNELIWREFYYSILYHHPEVLSTAYQPAYRRIPWRDSMADLAAWQDGLTGYPVVDAAMRQLKETGWMHNRARMIVASFLVKNLLVNWQEGETWFMRHLVDGDPACNNGGWQWSAGVGTDAAPYFRIFNPISQGQKHDPNGEYIKRYIPELRQVPPGYIHTPWLMPDELQSLVKCRIGKDYPGRIVDVTQTKERTLSAYKISRLAEAK